MSPVRLLIVGERFWPLVDCQAVAMEQMGAALADLGMRVTYLTRRWDKGWPEHFQIGASQVQYVAAPTKSIFSGQRSGRNLQQALHSLHDQFDALIVCGTGEFLSVPLHWARQHCVPCLLWMGQDAVGEEDVVEAEFSESAPRAGEWLRIVYEQSEFAERWRVLDLPASMVEFVPPSILLDAPATVGSRAALQAALATVDPRLRVDSSQSTVLAVGPVHAREAWLRLINAWPHVLARRPQARLWLMGGGDGFANLWEHARRNHNTDTIDFLGWFDDLDEIFGGVDVLVLPDRPALGSRWCLRAMWLGLPVLARDDPGADAVARRMASRFSGTTALEWAADLIEVLAVGRGSERIPAARDYVARHHDLALAATRWERWLRAAVESKAQVGG